MKLELSGKDLKLFSDAIKTVIKFSGSPTITVIAENAELYVEASGSNCVLQCNVGSCGKKCAGAFTVEGSAFLAMLQRKNSLVIELDKNGVKVSAEKFEATLALNNLVTTNLVKEIEKCNDAAKTLTYDLAEKLNTITPKLLLVSVLGKNQELLPISIKAAKDTVQMTCASRYHGACATFSAKIKDDIDIVIAPDVLQKISSLAGKEKYSLITTDSALYVKNKTVIAKFVTQQIDNFIALNVVTNLMKTDSKAVEVKLDAGALSDIVTGFAAFKDTNANVIFSQDKKEIIVELESAIGKSKETISKKITGELEHRPKFSLKLLANILSLVPKQKVKLQFIKKNGNDALKIISEKDGAKLEYLCAGQV